MDSVAVGADIGVTVLRKSSDGSYVFAASSGTTVDRQNQTEVSNLFLSSTHPHSTLHLTHFAHDQVFLDPGEYVVVPVSSGCKFEQDENNSRDTVNVYCRSEIPILVIGLNSDWL